MKKLITLLLILIPFLGYSQIPPSEGPDLFGTRHFISLDGNDTLAISQGDTARITATDSIFVDKLQGYEINAGFTGDTITYTYENDSVTLYGNTVDMYDNDSYMGWLKKVTIPEKTMYLPSGLSYIGAYWNNGDPEYRRTSDRTDLNVSDGIPIMTLFKQNGNVLTKTWNIGDGMAERTFFKDVHLDRIERVSGHFIDTLNSVNVEVSPGTSFYGLKKYDTSDFSSLEDSMYFYSYDGTDWSYTDTTEVVRTYYNPETGLEEMTNNRYTTVWFYQAICCPDREMVFMLAGNRQYNKLEDALADNTQPTNRPDIVDRFGILLGRMVVKKGEDEVREIQTAFSDVSFSGGASAGVTDHGDLTGLDDPGDHPWAVEWADTTDVVTTQYWTENTATAFDAANLGGHDAGDYLRRDQDETVTGQWQFSENLGIGNESSGPRIYVRDTTNFNNFMQLDGSIGGIDFISNDSRYPKIYIQSYNWQESRYQDFGIKTGSTDPFFVFDTDGIFTANNLNTTVQSLSGTSVTMDAGDGHNAEITLSDNTTITLSNLEAGTTGNITVDNPSSAYDITLDGYTFEISPVLSPSGDTITMSGNDEKDVLSWYYDGSQVFINGTLAYE